MPAPPVAVNKYDVPATQLLIVLYSPPKAQVVMVTGVLFVGAVAVPKALEFVHCENTVCERINKLKNMSNGLPMTCLNL